jgi:hypothetical protein
MAFMTSNFTNIVSPKVSFFCLSAFALCVTGAFLDFDQRDYPLQSTTGVLSGYEAQRAGRYTLWLHREGAADQKLSISAWRSTASQYWQTLVGQEIRFENFGGEVSNCWVGGKQVCFSKCVSDIQCKRDNNVSESRIMTIGAVAIASFYCAVLGWAVFKRKERPSSD